MPAAAKPARLWLKPRSDGASFWYITTPTGERVATGIPALDREAAERALAERVLSAYLVERHILPSERAQRPDSIYVGDVLSLYVQTAGPRVSRPDAQGGRLHALLDFFGTMTLAEVNSRSCASYVAQRGSKASARRELEDLKAAINHHRNEGLSAAVIPISLPAKGAARERWLTRSEAARLIWAAWRYRQPQRGKEMPRRSRQHSPALQSWRSTAARAAPLSLTRVSSDSGAGDTRTLRTDCFTDWRRVKPRPLSGDRQSESRRGFSPT
jgi:hypothetical protein